MKLKKITILFIFFFIEEIKIFRTRIVNLFVNFQEFHILRLIYENLFVIENCKIFKIEEINKFINFNKKNIKEHYIEKRLNNKIFVESFINHPLYTIQNCVIANSTSKVLKRKCCGILREGDIKSRKIFNSYGINEIIYIGKGNIITRFYNLIIAFSLLKNVKSIASLISLKFDNIEIGRMVYEQHLRFNKNPSVNKINKEFYFFLSQALILNSQFKKIFKNNRNSYLVQAETQYFPFRLSMSNAIKFNLKMISRRGGISQFGLKIFTKKLKNLKESRNRPPAKVYKLIHKELSKKNIDSQTSNSSKLFNDNWGLDPSNIYKKKKKIKKFISKIDVCKFFNFDKKKPIILILAHELSDGNFQNSWNLFHNDLMWLEETIKKIKNNDNANWIIKSHPDEVHYKSKIKIKDVYAKLAKNCKNIKLFPANRSIENFNKFTSVVISSHGSAAFQYPLKSIPTIVCGESPSSGFGFTIEPKSKFEYFNILKRINTIKKLNDKIVKRCFAFNYLYKYVSLEALPIFFESDISMKFNKVYFWKRIYKLTKKTNLNFNSFLISLKFLLNNNNSYYLNLRRLDELKKF